MEYRRKFRFGKQGRRKETARGEASYAREDHDTARKGGVSCQRKREQLREAQAIDGSFVLSSSPTAPPMTCIVSLSLSVHVYRDGYRDLGCSYIRRNEEEEEEQSYGLQRKRERVRETKLAVAS